jgi:hypothetical protein
MPNLPDIPGKSLVTGTTKRAARVLAGAAGAGALAVGGLVAKRVLGGKVDEEERGANADAIAQAPTAPPGAEEKPVPETKAAAPKPLKAKPVGPKPKAEPKSAAKPKPKAAPKPKADAKPKPPKPSKPKPAAKPKAAAKLRKPSAEPGNISGDKEPHHALNNPVGDPDGTEYPDPYEKRDDPRDPVDPDGAPFGDEPHPQTGSESTSEPPLSQDPEVIDGGRPPKRDKLDD